MTRVEIVDEINAKTGIHKKDIRDMLQSLDAIFEDCMARHDEVKLLKGLRVDCHESAARNGVNPLTGEKVKYPATFRPKAHFTPHIKEVVKG